MARPTLDRNVKYKLLLLRAKPLGLTKPQVRGLLETMWDVCHECGDIRFASGEHVEASAEWWGEAGAWVALISAEGTNFLDRAQDGTYEVHDFWDHCPEYVKARRRMEKRRKDCSEQFRTIPNSLEKYATPAPAPAPAPNIDKPPAAVAPVAPCPLAEFPRLASMYLGIREHLQRAHPRVKLPKVDSAQGQAERATLARLVRLDGYSETEVIHALRWVLKSEGEQAEFWRSNFRAIPALRKTRDGASKFTKIFDAMARDAEWPPVPPEPHPAHESMEMEGGEHDRE